MSAAERAHTALTLFNGVHSFFAQHFPDIDRLVVTPSNQIAELATSMGAQALIEGDAPAGLNHAAGAAVQWAKRRGYSQLLIVPADIPVWATAEVTQLLSRAADYDVVIGRATMVGRTLSSSNFKKSSTLASPTEKIPRAATLHGARCKQ
ncbi:hypothetical protein AWV80_26165 [Cupriavidus sp. UYMU48A]|nr:hypothetical protein AWV80_26165 [Cupriavidus sp. UYMU48A]